MIDKIEALFATRPDWQLSGASVEAGWQIEHRNEIHEVIALMSAFFDGFRPAVVMGVSAPKVVLGTPWFTGFRRALGPGYHEYLKSRVYLGRALRGEMVPSEILTAMNSTGWALQSLTYELRRPTTDWHLQAFAPRAADSSPPDIATRTRSTITIASAAAA